MKKILIRSYGDAIYGLGHLIRSVALAKYLRAYYDVFIYFAVSPHDSKQCLDFLKMTEICLVDFNQIQNNNFDHLIYDMPFYDRLFFELVRDIKFEKKLGLDYFFYNSDDVDVALNLYSHDKPEISKFEIKDGIHYAILRDNILNKDRKAIGCQPENILITFGSADPCNNTCRVLDKLQDTNLKISIILGVLFKNEVAFEKCIRRFDKERLNIVRNVSNIEDYIMANNLIFCGGGTTLLECIHLCRPCIAVSQSAKEYKFAQTLSDSGLCHVMSHEELNLASMEAIFKMDFCTSISYACQKIDLGSGKKLIAEELMGLRDG